MARKPFPKKSHHKTQAILDLIHTGICGPMETSTPGGKRYLMTLIDDYSRYTTVYLLTSKDEAEPQIKRFIQMMKTQFGEIPKYIRSDRGKEYINKALHDFYADNGIRMQHTAGYSPPQNGVAERKNRSLIEIARCILIDADIDKKYWGEAVSTANFLQNRLPTKATDRTPYESWYKEKPIVKNLHVFGCKALVHVPKELRKKLDAESAGHIFIGYSEESKAFRFINAKTGSLKTSRNATFFDGNFNGNPINAEDQNQKYSMFFVTPILEKTKIKEAIAKNQRIQVQKTKPQEQAMKRKRKQKRATTRQQSNKRRCTSRKGRRAQVSKE